jgi:putative transposase
MPKATYMDWQKRFDRENPDKELEEKILKIAKTTKITVIVEYWGN